VGKIGKKAATLNIFDPLMHHWGQGAFDSSRKGMRGKYKNIAGGGAGMTKAQRRDFQAREEAKGEGYIRTPLTSRYS